MLWELKHRPVLWSRPLQMRSWNAETFFFSQYFRTQWVYPLQLSVSHDPCSVQVSSAMFTVWKYHRTKFDFKWASTAWCHLIWKPGINSSPCSGYAVNHKCYGIKIQYRNAIYLQYVFCWICCRKGKIHNVEIIIVAFYVTEKALWPCRAGTINSPQ